MGRVEDAREAVRAALGESAATGGRYYDGQLLRLQEELAGAEPRVGAGPEGQLRPGSPSTGGPR
jgi:hypothetical protein